MDTVFCPKDNTILTNSTSQDNPPSILDYLNNDRIVDENSTEYICICPICGDDNFKIRKDNGKYQCWGNKCSPKEIYKKIVLLEKQGIRRSDRPSTRKSDKKKVVKSASIPDTPVEFARLPEDRVIVKGEKKEDSKRGLSTFTEYIYSSTQKVLRIDPVARETDPTIKKDFFQQHIDASGKWHWSKGDLPWPMYREEECLKYGVGKAVVWTEGERCVECFRYLGFVNGTFQGKDWNEEIIHAAALRHKEAGVAEIIFMQDNDEPGRTKAKTVEIACAKAGIPCTVLDLTKINPELKEKGDIIDLYDWAKKKGMDAPNFIRELEMQVNAARLEKQLALQADFQHEEFEQDNVENEEKDKNKKLPPYVRLVQFVSEELGDRLQLDILTGGVRLDGEEKHFIDLQTYLEKELETSFAPNRLIEIVVRYASQNPYSSVVEYLDTVAAKYSYEAVQGTIDKICNEAFHLQTDLEKTFFRRTLIGAIARAKDPGCKHDDVLVLQGNQGYQKTTALQALAGKKWFDTLDGELSNKDTLLKCYKRWLLEYGELEAVFGRKDNGYLKGFLSKEKDDFRAPYERHSIEHQRHFLFVATVNPEEFLTDPTGDRRYWTCKITQKINIKLIEKYRDELWAEACYLYQQGVQHWLTDEELALSRMNNEKYSRTSVWFDLIVSWTEKHATPFTTAQVLTDVLQKPVGQWSKKDEMEVAACLRKLGYEKKAKKIQGVSKQVWFTAIETQLLDHAENSLVKEVSTQLSLMPETSPQPRSEQVDTYGLKPYQEVSTTPEVTTQLVVEQVDVYELTPIEEERLQPEVSTAEILYQSQFQATVDTVDTLDGKTFVSEETLEASPKFKAGDRVALDGDISICLFVDSSRFDTTQNCFMYEIKPFPGEYQEDRLMDFEQARSRIELDF